jgi:hypothetical protein
MAPRATALTAHPAALRRAPMKPPIAPTPYTQTVFMSPQYRWGRSSGGGK